MTDPYEVLGVPADAPADEVRAAYVRLARRHHPDYFTTAEPAVRAEAERRMQAVNSAWAAVGDADRRTAFDRGRAASGPSADPGFRPFDAGDDDPDPLTVADAPYRVDAPAAAGRRRAATLAPVALLAAAGAVLALGLVLAAPGLLGFGAVLFVLGLVGFLVVPLFELSRAMRDE